MASALTNSTNLTSKGFASDIRIILLGRSGEGKSELGNLLLGSKTFKTGGGAGSVTRKCQSSSIVFNNRKITVIDTPGLFDTQLSTDQILEELTRSYYEAAPGPHGFLIVTSGRYTTEAKDTLTLLTQLFSESVVDYCIIVITHEDDLTDDNTTKEQFLGDQTSELRCLVDKCGNRCIAVNSKTKDSDERKKKLSELIEYIDSIAKSKQTSYYTHDLFEKAAQDEIKRRQNEEKKIRDELGEAEIRMEEDSNFQQREEEARNKQNQQKERTEDRRRQRDNEQASGNSDNEQASGNSDNDLSAVFLALAILTAKAFFFVLRLRGNRRQH